MSHPHKSTTHKEQYIHIKSPLHINGKDFKGCTVFFRWEWVNAINPDIDKELRTHRPFASIAYCSETDNWCRKIGRTTARRHYFAGRRINLRELDISYELANQIYHGLIQ